MFFRRKKKASDAEKQTAPAASVTQADAAGGPSAPTHVSDRDLLRHLVDSSTAAARMRRLGGQGPETGTEARNTGADPASAVPRNRFGLRQSVAGRANTPLADNAVNAVDNAPRADAAQGSQRESGADTGTRGQPSGRRRTGRLRALGHALQALGALAVGLAILLFSLFIVYRASIWIYGWLHTSPMFLTRHIDVTGNVRLQRDVILALGGIREGVSSFSVSVAAVERKLRRTPWVEDVSVQRILPDRFVIRIQERMPSFWIRRGGRLYYANERGEIIAPVESDNFMSLPILTIEPGCEDAIPYLSRLMKDMRSGILPVDATAIATVDVSPGRGVELYLEDREMRLSLAPDDWDGNLLRLGVTIGDLARRRELSGVREVRATRGSVWVVLRQPAQQP